MGSTTLFKRLACGVQLFAGGVALCFASPVIAQEAPTLVVKKTATFVKELIKDGRASAGEVIRYSYTVQNKGTVPIVEIGLKDEHSGFGDVPKPSNEQLTSDVAPLFDSIDLTANDGAWTTLGPGDEITLTWDYTVTQLDVEMLQ